MKLRLKILISSLILFGCSSENTTEINNSKTQNDGWKHEGQISKTIDYINFVFPDSGYAYQNKEELIEQSFQAVDNAAEIIGIGEFHDTIEVRFLPTRNHMKKLTNMPASGVALAHLNALYVVADGEKSPPIKHEMAHLIAILKWGYPANSSIWINEGIATYAEDQCNGFKVAEIYRFFMEEDMLISTDSLVTAFYYQPEMIAYHQSAYVVEYLLTNYSINQFQQLWVEGFDHFQNIYGVNYSDFEEKLQNELLESIPESPEIDWEEFKEGCM